MTDAEDDGTGNLQNDGNNLPNNTATRPRGPEYLDSNYSKQN
jgi:hypothetical protein